MNNEEDKDIEIIRRCTKLESKPYQHKDYLPFKIKFVSTPKKCKDCARYSKCKEQDNPECIYPAKSGRK